MYIDESIQLREGLPQALLEKFQELKGYYDEGSREDLNEIFLKYGIA